MGVLGSLVPNLQTDDDQIPLSANGQKNFVMRPQSQQPAPDIHLHFHGDDSMSALGDIAKATEPAPRSILGDKVPAGQPIPANEMNEAEAKFKREKFHDNMQEFDNDHRRLEYLQKQGMISPGQYVEQSGIVDKEKLDYQNAHPWGTPESAHPGVFGKIGHVLGKIGNIAGDVLAPATMTLIPGTQLNREARMQGALGQIQQGSDIVAKEDKNTEKAGDWAIQEATDAEGKPSLVRINKLTGEVQPVTGFGPKAPAVKEGEEPLGERVASLNTALERRYQVLNPGQKLPADLALPANATQKDFDRIDKVMQQTEQAKGTKAQQDTVNEMRREAAQQAAQARQQAQADREERMGKDNVVGMDKDGKTVYETRADAKANGHRIVTSNVGADQVEKARQAHVQYARMIDNAQTANDSMAAWDNENDRKLAMRVERKFVDHIPATGINGEYIDTFLNDDDYKAMTPAGRAHFQNMLQLWSDVLQVIKLETGGVPRGQGFLEKEDPILPRPEKTADMNRQAINAFVKRMVHDSGEYPRPADVKPFQRGLVPPDAQGAIQKDGVTVGYVDKNGKRVDF